MIRPQSSVRAIAPLVLMAAALAACAHGGAPPTTRLPTEQAANARAVLYSLCAVDGGSKKAVTRVGRYVRLTCSGSIARALFDEAAAFSRNRGRESQDGAVTVRRIGAEPWFDTCRHDTVSDAYACFVHLLAPVDFLDPEKDAAPPAKGR